MKLFFIILCFYFFNILNACSITFFDKVQSYNTMYGHMKFQKELQEDHQFDKVRISHVFFIEKDYSCVGESFGDYICIGESLEHECIGETFACWRHCFGKKHTAYDAYVIKKESFGAQKYHICVYNSHCRHVFDMIIAKNEISKDYDIHMFREDKNICIFTDTSLAKKECCCIFPGNDLVKLLQKDLIT